MSHNKALHVLLIYFCCNNKLTTLLCVVTARNYLSVCSAVLVHVVNKESDGHFNNTNMTAFPIIHKFFSRVKRNYFKIRFMPGTRFAHCQRSRLLNKQTHEATDLAAVDRQAVEKAELISERVPPRFVYHGKSSSRLLARNLVIDLVLARANFLAYPRSTIFRMIE